MGTVEELPDPRKRVKETRNTAPESCLQRLLPKRPMANEQGEVSGLCLTKGSFYPARIISPRTSFCFIVCRTAGYATRISGCVGGGSREVTPYPDGLESARKLRDFILTTVS